MADKDARDLEAVLARLERGWRDLAQLLRSPAPPSGPVLEAEKFRLLDPAGRLRGELRLAAEGGAALVLNDLEGRVRAQLGLDEAGGAFLTLRDRYGGIIFQVPDGPQPSRAPAEAAAAPGALEPALVARLEQVGADVTALREMLQAREQAEPEAAPPVPGEPQEEAAPGLTARLHRVERQVRRWKLAGAAALALALLTLAGLGAVVGRVEWRGGPVAASAFLLQGPAGAPLARLAAPEGRARLDFLDQAGKTRASLGLAPDGEPALSLYDQAQTVRAALELGPEGEPALNLRDESGVLRAALGNVGPKNLGPEATMVRETSSLTLFDDKGRLTWQAPRRWRP